MAAGRRWAPWLAVATIVTAVTVFFVFMASSALLGGDALNGHVVDGHCFVSDHGKYTEVSAADWNLNHSIGLAMMILWPFAMASAAFILFRYVFPYLMTGETARSASPRVAEIEGRGAPVWSGSPGGRIGGVNMSRSMLGVEVYPDALILRPRFMTPIVIDADAITFVTSAWRLTSMIEIRHTSPEAQSPIFLYARRTSDLGRAIDALARAHATRAASTDSRASTAGPLQPAPGRPPGPMRALSALGLVVGGIMVAIGVFVMIPQQGTFGLIWTGIAVVVLIANVRRFVRQGW